MTRRARTPPTPPAPPTDGGPAVGDAVVIRGRVHAIAVGGSLRCVETCTGGYVWALPSECEAVGRDEVRP